MLQNIASNILHWLYHMGNKVVFLGKLKDPVCLACTYWFHTNHSHHDRTISNDTILFTAGLAFTLLRIIKQTEGIIAPINNAWQCNSAGLPCHVCTGLYERNIHNELYTVTLWQKEPLKNSICKRSVSPICSCFHFPNGFQNLGYVWRTMGDWRSGRIHQLSLFTDILNSLSP